MTWRILVVDDDATVRGLMGTTLRRRGVDVVEASGAEPALDRLRDGAFDLLVTNLEMPGRSGLWLLRQARHGWPEMPVVVVTGGIPEGQAAAVLRYADAVLTKPFTLSALYERVASVLGEREADG